jgi:hypothetical protein
MAELTKINRMAWRISITAAFTFNKKRVPFKTRQNKALPILSEPSAFVQHK